MRIKKEFKIEHAMSKDETRFVLQNAMLETEKDACLVATDGRILAKVPVELEDGDVKGYVSKEALIAARKAAPKVLDTAGINCNGSLAIPDGPTFPRPTEGHFPNWKMVFPNAPVTFKVSFDVALLVRLCKALGDDHVTLAFRDALTAIEVTPTNLSLKSKGLLMPLKV